MEYFNIKVRHSNQIPETIRKDIVSLCSRAYEKDMQPILETFVEATHVLGYYHDLLVCHALWVTRFLQAGTDPMMRTAYVEAVATEAKYRSRSFASAVMKHLVGEVQEYDLAALSPFSVEYYQRLGWELWQGPLFIRTKNDLMPSLDDEEVMIFRLPKTPWLDLTGALSAEWRTGELW